MNEYKLFDEWCFYIHFPKNNDWTIESYHKIIKTNNLLECIETNNRIGENLLKKSLLFVMKNNVLPLWEHETNIKGGCFSFKIHNKEIEKIWKCFLYKLLGKTLFNDKKIDNHVNGISLSPKTSFCILKIWMDNDEYQDPNSFLPIMNVDLKLCIFKKYISD